MTSSEHVRRAVELARAGKREEARDLFLRVVEDDPRNELAWMWLAGLVERQEDRIIACENVLTINPSNENARKYLAYLSNHVPARTVKQALRADPLTEAEYLEQEGKLDKALMIYKVEAAKTDDMGTFNTLYKRILQIEQLQAEKIRFVPPRAVIIRLSFVWPLLYLSLAFVQVGLNPMKDPASYLWFAFPWVMLGSYLVAVAEVRSRHVLWKRLFLEEGEGSVFARSLVGIVGWLMVIIPLALIVVDSLNRLAEFEIPPRLF